MNGVVPEDTFAFVELPDGEVWRLRRWLYGMRPAASAWEADFSGKLESVGFARGKSCPTVFYRASTGCRCVVHGDGFTFLSSEEEIGDLVRNFEKWYEIKVRGVLGGGKDDQHEITILNRHLRWKGMVIEHEADDKHAWEIVKEMGLEGESKGLEAPCEKLEV